MESANACECGAEPELEYYLPLTDLMNLLSNKYAMQTISVIDAHGPMRFVTLEDHLPAASSSTISNRLEELVDAELVTRTQYDEIPLRVEYELTEAGHELQESLESLLDWTSSWQSKN